VVALGFTAATLLILGSCATPPKVAGLPSANREVLVRLADASDGTDLQIRCPARMLVRDPEGRRFGLNARSGVAEVVVRVVEDSRVTLDPVPGTHAWVVLTPGEGGALEVAGRRYRGELLVGAREGALVAINRLRLDHYLYGVVPGEVPASWPEAALEAQAIAARSYALHEATHRAAAVPGDPLRFDVHDDVRSQVYGGVSAENPRTTRAVDETHGLALVAGGEIVHTYFHSTCGGHTADARQVLGEPDTPAAAALRGRPCGHCTSSKYYEWEMRASLAELGDGLSRNLREAAGGRDPGRLTRIEGGRTDRAGRLLTLRATTDAGVLDLPATQARLAIGPSKLRSLLCRIDTFGSEVVASGRGWGHGAGMCQIGARELADLGRSGADIATFYYQGAHLARLPEHPSAP
jgi:stage II sporulation protein D